MATTAQSESIRKVYINPVNDACIVRRMALGRLEAVTSTIHLDFDKQVAQSCYSKTSLRKRTTPGIEVNLDELCAWYEPHSLNDEEDDMHAK